MSGPRFTLHVVATLDGFIARRPGHAPADWASPEEQRLFRQAVAAADWSVMGRRTHEAAYREERRRVVFSRSARRPEWRAPNHLWLDPEGLAPEALAPLTPWPAREAAVLGGVTVHDWFHAHGRLDAVELTVEPLRFGEGLPVFGDQSRADPFAAFAEKGYCVVERERLNAGGTERFRLLPGDSPEEAESARR